MADMIPLPKLPEHKWTLSDGDWIISPKELQAIQREAMRVALEHAAKVCDGVYYQYIGPENGSVRYGIAASAAAIRALLIEGEA